MLRALLLPGLAFAAVTMSGPMATAAPGYGSERLRVVVRSPVAGPLCDRREVGECQDTARSRAIMCDAFSDRLSCADAVLRAQSACFRATRCY